MADKVTRLPVRYRRKRKLTPTEIWDSPDPSDFMVWKVCRYLRLDKEDNRCAGCPRFRNDDHFGKVKDGCRTFAEETCRVVTAVQRRELAGKFTVEEKLRAVSHKVTSDQLFFSTKRAKPNEKREIAIFEEIARDYQRMTKKPKKEKPL
jgi:hypothetical protein